MKNEVLYLQQVSNDTVVAVVLTSQLEIKNKEVLFHSLEEVNNLVNAFKVEAPIDLVYEMNFYNISSWTRVIIARDETHTDMLDILFCDEVIQEICSDIQSIHNGKG